MSIVSSRRKAFVKLPSDMPLAAPEHLEEDSMALGGPDEAIPIGATWRSLAPEENPDAGLLARSDTQGQGSGRDILAVQAVL